MGLFMCDLCEEHLDFDTPHVCNNENIRKRIHQLEQNARTAEFHVNEIQNAVFMVIQELPSLEGKEISVNAGWLRKLWDAAQGRWYDAKTPEKFLVRWLATHRILSEAFDVFRSNKYGKKESLLEKLKNLREACDSAKKVLEYEDSKFDMSPEDLV